VFSNVYEQPHESPDQTENILKGYLVSGINLSQNLVDNI